MHVRVDDGEIFCTVHGDGAPLLVLGGIHLSHGYLRPWVDPLAGAYRLIYLDHRGTGRSSRPDPDDLDHDVWVRDIEAIRRELDLGRIVLLGHSYGGFLAQLYALRYPDRLRALILCGTAPAMDYLDAVMARLPEIATPAQLEAVQTVFSGPAADDAVLEELWLEILPLYFHRWDPEAAAAMDARSDYSAPAFNRAFFACLPTFSTVDRLHEIRTPTLVTGGRHDWIMPPSHTVERLAAGLPGSELVVFEESGHFPFVEEHEPFVSTVRDWLTKLDRDSVAAEAGRGRVQSEDGTG